MTEDEDKSTKSLRDRVKGARNATMNHIDLAKMGLLRMTSKGNLYEPSTKGTVTFEGWLYKKSPGGIPLIRHWHKRWFVLEAPGKLLYFSDQAKTDLKGIIPLDMVERMLYRSTRLTLLMEASEDAPSRKFSLKADSEAEVKTWVMTINQAFEEIDRLEEEAEEADQKVAPIGEGDSKYWKVETRKKLNLSVALDKKKKGQLKISPRAAEIEADIAAKEAQERKRAAQASSESPAAAASPSSGSLAPSPEPNKETGVSSSPVEAPVPVPVEVHAQVPVEVPVEAPVEVPVEAPVEAPVPAQAVEGHANRSVTLS